jgi:hypothetical protein
MSDALDSIFKGAGSAIRAFSDGIKKNIIDIQVSDVLSKLKELEIKKVQYTSEKKVEGVIVKYLNDSIGRAHSQYNIGGYLGLKVDIDLGDGQVGIELKLAKELVGNATNIERLFGQVVYYSKRKYKDKLVVLVVGNESENTQVVKEIEKFITELGVFFHYITVKA